MTVFVDTAALYALLDEDDLEHPRAAAWFRGPGSDVDEELVTHAYVVVEAAALVHRRLGARAVRVLLADLVPALTVRCVDEDLHQVSVAAYLAGLRRGVSLVDQVSFELMRADAIEAAFTFDDDFVDEGFRVVP